MSTDKSGIGVAVIGAISAIAVAWITAGGVASKTTEDTINDSENQLGELIEKVDALEETVEETASDCPRALTKSNFGKMKVYSEQRKQTRNDIVKLVDLQGAGCLITSTLTGYYFHNESDGALYTINLSVDGQEIQYPPKSSSRNENILAFAQDNEGENTGILVIPAIRFEDSIKIEFRYVGAKNRDVRGYAILLMDEP